MSTSSNYSITALLGLISSLFILLLSRKNRRRISTEKLNIVREALEQADRRLDSLLERHDELLSRVCSQGLLCNLLSRKNRRRISTEKLNIVREALEQADRRLDSLLERHDELLSRVCSQGLLCNRELHNALLESRKAVVKASEFAAAFRRLQMSLVGNFPDF